MPPPVKSILWVDDEGELLEAHRIFLRSKGYDVEWASNADDAVEMLRRRPFDIMLLDEQMPGKRGLEAYRDVRELAPNLPVVMVTKSEEDATLKEAIGANIRDYLVKPINPRQVLSIVTQILEGPRIRQQAIARRFVERFRAIELERDRDLDWRGWIERFDELMRWDVELAAAGEMGLYDSLRGLYPDMHREFAAYMKDQYPAWLKNLEETGRRYRSISSRNFFCRSFSAIAPRYSSSSIVCDSINGACSSRCSLHSSKSRPLIISPFFPPRLRTRATRCSADFSPEKSPRVCLTGGETRIAKTNRSTRMRKSCSRITS